MIRQVDIHLKLDVIESVKLTQEVFMTGIPRNRIINMAVYEYVRMAQTRRRWILQGHGEEFTDKLREICPQSVHL